MTQTISLYAVIFLILALLATGGTFYTYREAAKTEIAELHRANAAYQISIDLQKATITQMEADAQRLASANRFLSERFAETEADYSADLTRIDGLDLSDTEGLEARVNAEFSRSIDGLRKATSRQTKARQ